MSFLGKKNKSTPFVIFDIGSASIGGALVVVSDDDNKARIIYETRTPITFQKNIEYDRLLIEMLSVLKNVAADVEYDGFKRFEHEEFDVKDIKDVFCVLASPWYVSDTQVFKLEKKEPFNVSYDFVFDILKNSDDKFKKNFKNQLNGKEINDPVLVEKEIIQILLNGYNTSAPYGKKVNRIDISMFTGMMSNLLKKRIENILERIFSTSNVSFHTFSLASFSAVRDIFNTEKNFLLMDISGEITDIILVRNETLVKSASFPLGKNSIIRNVAKALKTIPEEAHSLLRLYIEGKSIGNESAKLEAVLSIAKQKWLSSFREILSDFSDNLSLPKTIFLTVDTDIGKLFTDLIKSDEFSSHTLAQEPFTVAELSSRILSEYCQAPKESSKGCDSFLALETLFFHKIANT